MHGTIVVADKSKTVRRMVEIALAKHPFDLEFAEDGNSASAAIKAKSPKIVIVDADLPGVDGYALTEQIKGGGGDTKVILLVGRNKTRYDAGRGRSAGVDDHLVKPFLTQKLIEKVFGAIGANVPDAAIFRTSLLNIPLAGGGVASPSVGGLSGGLGASTPAATPTPAPAPKAPVSIAKPAAAPEPPASNAFEQEEPTKQYEPPADAGAVAESAAQMVLDAAAFKEALGEEGPAREMFEKVVWEVVPQLAEAILKEEIAKVVRERMAQAG